MAHPVDKGEPGVQQISRDATIPQGLYGGNRIIYGIAHPKGSRALVRRGRQQDDGVFGSRKARDLDRAAPVDGTDARNLPVPPKFDSKSTK
ncbi:hypothetical protein [Nioella nitratireducens]|uniref:hypothetical protein n=1 Tax=Nioella nitratireducens TaxID=1287720 RepID=UPI0008FD3022|nr:hypothetical protein [Nioella nitratireducens]